MRCCWFIGILIVCAVQARAGTPDLPRGGLRIDGGFIQYQGPMLKLGAEHWRAELAAMRAAGMKTIVLQWLERTGQRIVPEVETDQDTTAMILTEADRHGMEVFLGLLMDERWWQEWNKPEYLEDLASRSIELAERVWRRYRRHTSFQGWYIPVELHDADFTVEQTAALKRFFRRISDRCKELSGDRPVAIAPYFVQNLKPKDLERVYTALLTDSGIDILMLQDGVGARGWDADFESRIIPMFRAMRDACLASGVELWSDLESFRLRSLATGDPNQKGFVPADAARIGRQLAAVAPFVKRFVTFDFYHYMSPHRGAAQKALYDAYVREFVQRPFYPVLGRSVEVDAGFSWYTTRSPRSLAAEIRAAGYSVVLDVVTADSLIDRALVEAFHAKGIGVWYCTFGNGTYSTRDLPGGWEAWRMVTRSDLAGKPLKDGYTRLCLNNAGYRAWRKAQVALVMREHPFDGVQIMEPHWPEYPGRESPAYSCFCDACRKAFVAMFPDETGLPEILNADSGDSPSKNPRRWERWIEFRKRSLTGFLDDLVNGTDGIRRTAPAAKVCTWTLALLGEDGPQRVLEDSGEDALEVARTVKPDLHCFQTHWPDWIRAELAPDYVAGYRSFIDPVKSALPALRLSIQADTGSQKQNRRSWEWIEGFEKASADVGALSTTVYEYHLGTYIYEDAPRVTEVRRAGDKVELLFTKRLDRAMAEDRERYALTPGRVVSAQVDGSIVTLEVEGVSRGERCVLTVRGLRDEPQRRFFKDEPATVLREQTVRFVK